MKRNHGQERNRQAYDMRQSGKTYLQIAKEIGRSVTIARNRVYYYDLHLQWEERQAARTPEEVAADEKAAQERVSGDAVIGAKLVKIKKLDKRIERLKARLQAAVTERNNLMYDGEQNVPSWMKSY